MIYVLISESQRLTMLRQGGSPEKENAILNLGNKGLLKENDRQGKNTPALKLAKSCLERVLSF